MSIHTSRDSGATVSLNVFGCWMGSSGFVFFSFLFLTNEKSVSLLSRVIIGFYRCHTNHLL